MVQLLCGFGENLVVIYYDLDLLFSYYYLVVYCWFDIGFLNGFGVYVVVYLGKYGNLEWLLGKMLGMLVFCGFDVVLGDLLLIYLFLVNDFGEGIQVKWCVYVVLVDYLIFLMVCVEIYGDIVCLEQLFDEYVSVVVLDFGKLFVICQQIWMLICVVKMDYDLGLIECLEEDLFDDMLLYVDGWLCEIKDVQICDGLYIFG